MAAVVGGLSYYMKKRKGSDPDIIECQNQGVFPEPNDTQTAREVISVSHRSADKAVVDFHPEISRQSDKLRSKKAYAALSMPFANITMSPKSFFQRKKNDLL